MKKYAMETVVGIFVVIGLGCIAYMALNLGHVSFGRNTYPLYASFSSVTGLRPGGPVEMFGLEVGQVGRITLDQKNQRAVVELQMNGGIQIYDDAIASIKTEGLIGDKYLSIDPGGAGNLLKPGGTITETQSPLDLIDLIGKYAFGEVKNQGESEKEGK